MNFYFHIFLEWNDHILEGWDSKRALDCLLDGWSDWLSHDVSFGWLVVDESCLGLVVGTNFQPQLNDNVPLPYIYIYK